MDRKRDGEITLDGEWQIMTIDSTIRKSTFTGDGTTGQVFTVLFAIEKQADVVVYDGSYLLQLTDDYTVSGEGLPGTTPNQFTVTLVGSTNNTVTIYRGASIPTQTKTISTGFQTKDMETGFDKSAIATSNTPLASDGSSIDLTGGRMQETADPTQDKDVANVDYMQREFSKKGKIASPVSGTDDNKALYSKSTTTVIWKEVFDVPSAPGTLRLLTVDWDGVPKWTVFPSFAPVFLNKPVYYLSLDTDGTTLVWRDIDTLPFTTNTTHKDAIFWQPAGNVAFREKRFLPFVPPQGEYVLGVSGGGSITTQSVLSTKVSYLKEAAADSNFSAQTTFFVKDRISARRHGILEWDLSSVTGVDRDTIISGEMQLSLALGSGTALKAKIARLITTFVEADVTWNENESGTSWDWQAGAFADVDLDMETYTMSIGSGGDTTVDITGLVLDAIENRSGILRILIYSDNPQAGTVSSKFDSDLGANPPKIEIKSAPARTLEWKESGSDPIQRTIQPSGGELVNTQPHITYSNLEDIPHGFSTDVSISSCSFSADASTVADPDTYASMIGPHLTCQYGNDQVIIFSLNIDLTQSGGAGLFDFPHISYFVYPETSNG